MAPLSPNCYVSTRSPSPAGSRRAAFIARRIEGRRRMRPSGAGAPPGRGGGAPQEDIGPKDTSSADLRPEPDGSGTEAETDSDYQEAVEVSTGEGGDDVVRDKESAVADLLALLEAARGENGRLGAALRDREEAARRIEADRKEAVAEANRTKAAMDSAGHVIEARRAESERAAAERKELNDLIESLREEVSVKSKEAASLAEGAERLESKLRETEDSYARRLAEERGPRLEENRRLTNELRAREEETKRLRAELKEGRSDAKKIQAKMDAVTLMAAPAAVEISELRMWKAEAGEEMEGMRGEIAALEGKCEERQVKILQQEVEISRLDTECEKQKRLASARGESFVKMQTEFRQEQEELVLENEALIAKTTSDFQAKVDVLSSKLEALECEKCNLEKVMQRQILELETECKAKQGEITENKDQILLLNGKNEEQKQLVSEKEACIEKMRSEYEFKIDALRAECEAREHKATDCLKQELHDTTERLERELRNTSARLGDQLSILSKERDLLRADAVEKRHLITGLLSESDRLREEIHDLKAGKELAASTSNASAERIRKLEGDLQWYRVEYEESTKILEGMEEENIRLNGEIDDLALRTKDAALVSDAAAGRIVNLEDKLEQCQAKYEESTKMLGGIEEENNRLRGEIGKLDLRKENAALAPDVSARRISDLENKLERCQAKYKKSKKAMAGMEEALMAVEKERKKLARELMRLDAASPSESPSTSPTTARSSASPLSSPTMVDPSKCPPVSHTTASPSVSPSASPTMASPSKSTLASHTMVSPLASLMTTSPSKDAALARSQGGSTP